MREVLFRFSPPRGPFPLKMAVHARERQSRTEWNVAVMTRSALLHVITFKKAKGEDQTFETKRCTIFRTVPDVCLLLCSSREKDAPAFLGIDSEGHFFHIHPKQSPPPDSTPRSPPSKKMRSESSAGSPAQGNPSISASNSINLKAVSSSSAKFSVVDLRTVSDCLPSQSSLSFVTTSTFDPSDPAHASQIIFSSLHVTDSLFTFDLAMLTRTRSTQTSQVISTESLSLQPYVSKIAQGNCTNAVISCVTDPFSCRERLGLTKNRGPNVQIFTNDLWKALIDSHETLSPIHGSCTLVGHVDGVMSLCPLVSDRTMFESPEKVTSIRPRSTSTSSALRPLSIRPLSRILNEPIISILFVSVPLLADVIAEQSQGQNGESETKANGSSSSSSSSSVSANSIDKMFMGLQNQTEERSKVIDTIVIVGKSGKIVILQAKSETILKKQEVLLKRSEHSINLGLRTYSLSASSKSRAQLQQPSVTSVQLLESRSSCRLLILSDRFELFVVDLLDRSTEALGSSAHSSLFSKIEMKNRQDKAKLTTRPVALKISHPPQPIVGFALVPPIRDSFENFVLKSTEPSVLIVNSLGHLIRITIPHDPERMQYDQENGVIDIKKKAQSYQQAAKQLVDKITQLDHEQESLRAKQRILDRHITESSAVIDILKKLALEKMSLGSSIEIQRLSPRPTYLITLSPLPSGLLKHIAEKTGQSSNSGSSSSSSPSSGTTSRLHQWYARVSLRSGSNSRRVYNQTVSLPSSWMTKAFQFEVSIHHETLALSDLPLRMSLSLMYDLEHQSFSVEIPLNCHTVSVLEWMESKTSSGQNQDLVRWMAFDPAHQKLISKRFDQLSLCFSAPWSVLDAQSFLKTIGASPAISPSSSSSSSQQEVPLKVGITLSCGLEVEVSTVVWNLKSKTNQEGSLSLTILRLEVRSPEGHKGEDENPNMLIVRSALLERVRSREKELGRQFFGLLEKMPEGERSKRRQQLVMMALAQVKMLQVQLEVQTADVHQQIERLFPHDLHLSALRLDQTQKIHQLLVQMFCSIRALYSSSSVVF